MSTLRAPSGAPIEGDPIVDPIAAVSLLDHWVAEGFITGEQAANMRADAAALTPTGGGHSKVASIIVEALGYLGAAIIVVALGLVIGRFWPTIPVWGRIGAGVVIAAALMAAGAWVPAREHKAADRLRSVLWLVACVVLGGTAAMVAMDVFDLRDEAVALIAFGTGGILAAVVWRLHPGPLQQAAFFVALTASTALTATLIVGTPDVPYTEDRVPWQEVVPGVSMWVCGVVWLALSWARVVRPPEVGKILGAVAMVFGAMTCMQFTWGVFLALATVAFLVVLAVRLRDFGVLIVSAVGTLEVLPTAVTQLFPGALAAAGALLVVGALLIIAAIYIARRRRDEVLPAEPLAKIEKT